MFTQFSVPVQNKFREMSKNELFVTSADLFEPYLAAWPDGSNPMFRTRSEHDCVTCKNFVRRLGNLVNIKGGKLITIWGDLELPYPYSVVAEKLDKIVQSADVVTVFRTKEKKYGETHNYDSKTNEKYFHFFGEVASRHYSTEPDTKRGEQETTFQVFYRGLNEIGLNDLNTVLDLIDSNSLYRGLEHREAVVGFRDLKNHFLGCNSTKERKLFAWENLGYQFARFRNTAIGTLLVDLAEGKDLEDAVKSFETKVAPANYKRPTALITQGMVEKAIETMTQLGLHGALARRFAKMSDVSVNDVLFVDNAAKGKMKDGIAALLEPNIVKSVPDLSHATKIPAEDFVKSVLPGSKTLDLFLENRHQGNFISLTGADGSERLFKWDNNFAWSYDGDVTDSVKQRVKAAGGNIDCKLRVSLSWYNYDDLDIHALTPSGEHIFFGNKVRVLDVDMNAWGERSRTPVENLAFTTLLNGVYLIYVNQYNRRETIDVGFAIEVEHEGQLRQFSYGKSVTGSVQCFKLHVRQGKLVEIETDLKGGTTSQEKWGVKTETLVPVAAAMYSPNHWSDNKVGAKHLIFALQGCKNPGATRGIYNEFLVPHLESHRKVFEVLGNKTKCAHSEEQVSGVGFTAARGDSVTVVVDGRRPYTLMF